MTPQFEEHNGKLFLMLDEPEPLRVDSEMPCLARLIQDDTDIGQHNIKVVSTKTLYRNVVVYEQSNLYAKTRGNLNNVPIYRLEIIGYPVVDGSAEWALYQMMQELRVCGTYRGETVVVYMSDPDYGFFKAVKEFGMYDGITIDEFHFLAHAEHQGWQIWYPSEEPKPEPIFKIGDKVTDGTVTGTIVHVEDGMVELCLSTQTSRVKLCDISHVPESPIDPIERPLRRLILQAREEGKNIRTWYQGLVFTPDSLTHYLEKGQFRWWNVRDWDLTDAKENMTSQEPKPHYQVVDFGAFKGTVRPVSTNRVHLWIHVVDSDDNTIASIRLQDLEPNLRKLVDELIRAQEGG